VRTVLVADHGDHRDLAVRRRPTLVVGLRSLRVQPVQHPLGDARHVPHPGRRGQHHDVGVEDLAAQRWPLVAVAHVDRHTGVDPMIRDAHGVALDAVSGERVEHLTGEQLAARRLRTGLETAYQRDGAKFVGHEVPTSLSRVSG